MTRCCLKEEMAMEQRNKPEMDVEAMFVEQALRERVDAALER